MTCSPTRRVDSENIYCLEQSLADVPAENHWLTPPELQTLSKLRFNKRRQDWRLGRWTAKFCIAAHRAMTGEPPPLSRIEIRSRESGAPFAVLLNENAFVTISLTHRAGHAMCALAPTHTAVGCDLELIEPRTDAFLSDYFTSEEQTLVHRMTTDARPLLVNMLWSAKESALKAVHLGLRADTRSISVRPLPDLGARIGSCPVRLSGVPSFNCERNDGPMWQPLEAILEGRIVFDGWWSASGPFVRTLVTVRSL